MKIWVTDGREVTLKRDTGAFKVVGPWSNSEIKRIIDKEWPDTTESWDRRMVCLVTSSDSEDWQCGSFGPNGRVCKRLVDHCGRCNNLFLPADKKKLTERLNAAQRQEISEIYGRPLSDTAVLRLKVKKLKAFLKNDGA